MSPEQKIWNISNCKGLNDLIGNQQVVICYGHFNIIHPGHIRYLEHAKSLGEQLVVAVQGDHLLTHSSNTHNFSEQERAVGLSWLNIVDMVLVLDTGELEDAILLLCPKFLVLGKEFEKERKSQLKGSLDNLTKSGGTVVFYAGEVQYATTELLSDKPFDIKRQRKAQFQQSCQKQNIAQAELFNALKNFSQSNLIVLGDTIVDQYIACDALGMSAEAPVLVVRELKTKEFVGGASIVAAHARQLGAQCHYLSVVGDDPQAELISKKLNHHNVPHTLITDSSRPTTFKMRYMVENQKIFRVSRLRDHSLSEELEEKVIEKLRKLAPGVNGILVSDFAYGVITDRILEELYELKDQHSLKLFGDLQCSSQVGNVSKFKNFDLLTPTEKEARIALGNRDDSVEWVANLLMEMSNTKNLLIKLGGEGFIAYSTEKDRLVNRQHFPALSTNPLDVAGAGDSLLACMAVSMSSGNPPMVSAALGACMASLAVQSLGNLPVRNERLQQMLNEQFSKDLTPS